MRDRCFGLLPSIAAIGISSDERGIRAADSPDRAGCSVALLTIAAAHHAAEQVAECVCHDVAPVRTLRPPACGSHSGRARCPCPCRVRGACLPRQSSPTGDRWRVVPAGMSHPEGPPQRRWEDSPFPIHAVACMAQPAPVILAPNYLRPAHVILVVFTTPGGSHATESTQLNFGRTPGPVYRRNPLTKPHPANSGSSGWRFARAGSRNPAWLPCASRRRSGDRAPRAGRQGCPRRNPRSGG